MSPVLKRDARSGASAEVQRCVDRSGFWVDVVCNRLLISFNLRLAGFCQQIQLQHDPISSCRTPFFFLNTTQIELTAHANFNTLSTVSM